MVIIRLSLRIDGIVFPYARFASSANHSNRFAAVAHSAFASAIGLPLSITICFANVSDVGTHDVCSLFQDARTLVYIYFAPRFKSSGSWRQ